MESAITLSLEAIKGIVVLVDSIRSTPSIVTKIKKETTQLKQILELVDRKSKMHILCQSDIDAFLSNQRTCNEILGRIQEILAGYVRGQRGRSPGWKTFLFEIGDKWELKELLVDFSNSVKYFLKFSELALQKAPLMQRIVRDKTRCSKERGPAMTISQFVQMQKEAKETKEEAFELAGPLEE